MYYWDEDDSTLTNLNKYRRAFKAADYWRADLQDDDTTCAKIKISGELFFRMAIRQRKDPGKPHVGPAIYFLRGDQTEPFGPRQDVGGMWIPVRDSTKKTLDYILFIFDDDLWSIEEKVRFFELLQHEVGHAIGIDHDTEPVNSHEAEECLVRNESEEEDIENNEQRNGNNGGIRGGGRGGGGGGGDDPADDEDDDRWECEWYRACAGVGPVQDPGDDPEIEDDPDCVWRCKWVLR